MKKWILYNLFIGFALFFPAYPNAIHHNFLFLLRKSITSTVFALSMSEICVAWGINHPTKKGHITETLKGKFGNRNVWNVSPLPHNGINARTIIRPHYLSFHQWHLPILVQICYLHYSPPLLPALFNQSSDFLANCSSTTISHQTHLPRRHWLQ